jgi:hypothetical protein
VRAAMRSGKPIPCARAPTPPIVVYRVLSSAVAAGLQGAGLQLVQRASEA